MMSPEVMLRIYRDNVEQFERAKVILTVFHKGVEASPTVALLEGAEGNDLHQHPDALATALRITCTRQPAPVAQVVLSCEVSEPNGETAAIIASAAVEGCYVLIAQFERGNGAVAWGQVEVYEHHFGECIDFPIPQLSAPVIASIAGSN